MLGCNLFFLLLSFFVLLQTCHAQGGLIGFTVHIAKDANTKDWVDGRVVKIIIINQPIGKSFRCVGDPPGRSVSRLNESNKILFLQCEGYNMEWNSNFGHFFGKLYNDNQIFGATTCKNGPIKTNEDGTIQMGSMCTIQES
ncbi:hypothetical protein BD770DRAFT_412988 [Pilaira anomala]|nr:hypothetical protein BD770DRAFT_412988 [Pilaira anomala]